jgi:hypothetical protein
MRVQKCIYSIPASRFLFQYLSIALQAFISIILINWTALYLTKVLRVTLLIFIF